MNGNRPGVCIHRKGAVAPVAVLILASAAAAQVPTTTADFFGRGTQPNTITVPLVPSDDCQQCHGFPSTEGTYTSATAPYDRWAASMMGQSMRDPIFTAALAIANQDAGESGGMCIRCHAPRGWLAGRSTPADGSALTAEDKQGVQCSVCHRMVDLTYEAGVNPPPDESILAALTSVPFAPGGGEYVIDPQDRRRGPFDVEADWVPLGGFFFHPDDTFESPLHHKADLCGTCHDVSNPVFVRQPNGTYSLPQNGFGQPHPTGNKRDMFPIERTYSEWSQSAFADGPIDMGGRFGGNETLISDCQNCHMPVTTGQGCALEPPIRDDLPQHNFNGSNTWVIRAIRQQYFDSETGLSTSSVNESVARAHTMLELASDMNLSAAGNTLSVRIINMTGHKLPTGYPEGRRMWLNVRFYDAERQLIADRGRYDAATATLTTNDTKVYEALLGLDAAVSALSGVPAGPSFHFVLNNVVYFDNRIPPMGFDNENFAAVQAAPVGYAYADGQHWDDTSFAIPAGTESIEAALYHQTTTKEYIEFLANENFTDLTGIEAYDLWVQFGMSPPALMDAMTIEIVDPGDHDDDGDVDLADYIAFQTCLDASGPGVTPSGACTQAFDFDIDHDVDLDDASAFQRMFTGP